MDRRHFLVAGAGYSLSTTLAFADEPVKMRDLYNRDLSFSDFAQDRADEIVDVTGFMAPPLKADSSFFVLTARPMAVCPFCESEADWPNDILAIYTQRTLDVVPFNIRITTRGRLKLDTYTDPEFGFVSRARLVDATFSRG